MTAYLLRRRFLLTLAAGFVPARLTPAGGWTSLFDGKSLSGWRKEGNASWSVEDAAIVGRQGPGGSSGDLFTEQQWADFELEAEWKMRWPGNSGIWFRRSAAPTGYQADFLDEPSYPNVLSGSLYCMGKRFIAENRDPASVRKDGWNRLRIRAAGEEIVIVQNGKRVAEVRDNTFPGPGSVGVQVHAGGQFASMEVRVRNIRIRAL